jgi:ketosteroid isomerase-like protein
LGDKHGLHHGRALWCECESRSHRKPLRSQAEILCGVSEENVELVRKAWAAFLSGDVERALESVHPDAVAFRAPPLPDPQTYHGPKGILQMYADWKAQFGEFQMATGEFEDAGDDVVVEVFQRGEGRASGAAVEGCFWFVYTVADGKIVRQDVFNDRNQAFEAAGLRE